MGSLSESRKTFYRCDALFRRSLCGVAVVGRMGACAPADVARSCVRRSWEKNGDDLWYALDILSEAALRHGGRKHGFLRSFHEGDRQSPSVSAPERLLSFCPSARPQSAPYAHVPAGSDEYRRRKGNPARCAGGSRWRRRRPFRIAGEGPRQIPHSRRARCPYPSPRPPYRRANLS